MCPWSCKQVQVNKELGLSCIFWFYMCNWLNCLITRPLLSVCCMSAQGCCCGRKDRLPFWAHFSTDCQPGCPCGVLLLYFPFIKLIVYRIFWRLWLCPFVCLLASSVDKENPSHIPPAPLLNSFLSNQRENELPWDSEVVWMGISGWPIKDMEEPPNQGWNEASISASVTEV